MARGFKTGGRKKGTPNKATIERRLRLRAGVQAAIDDGLLPLDVMLARMRGDTAITDQQYQAAVAAAPYVHPKLAAIALPEQGTDFSELSDDELHAMIRDRLQSYLAEASGEEPTPPSASH